MTLGEYIRLYRAEHGLSQREFVDRCGGGITHGYISIIEKGVNPNTGKASRPSLDKLYAIARGMGMSVSDLAKKVDDFGDAASIVAESTVPPRPTNALPYTPSRSMVAVVGSVRCGPPNAAYPNTCPCRAGVRDERQQAAMMSRLFYIKKSPGRSRGYCLTLRRPSGRRAAHPSRRSSPRSCSGSAVRTQPPRWPLNPP